MNCNNFEAIISDLAREQMLEAHTRESALQHVEACAACALLLEDERALTRGLRSLAAGMQHLEAPATIEANLLAKFREHTVAAEQSAPIVVQMPQRASTWQRWYPQAVAAAVIIMFAIGGASMLRLRQRETTAPTPGTTLAANSNRPESQQAAAPGSEATPASSDATGAAMAQEDDTDKGAGPGQKLSANEVAALMGAPAPRSRGNAQRVSRTGIGDAVKTPTSGEIATEFMPVSYGDNLNEIDNGRIVRVEMPRSALAQFGIPVNMDRANERIKADVIIGDDGMARAIRFVK
jgi:hypothetical protein